MAQGLALPLGVVQGRAALVSGEDQLKKIIIAGLSPCDSDNPFQDFIDTTALVFQIKDAHTRSMARRLLTELFARLEADNRARLIDIAFDPADASGEQSVTLKYMNLETTRTEEFTLPSGSSFASVRSTTTGTF